MNQFRNSGLQEEENTGNKCAFGSEEVKDPTVINAKRFPWTLHSKKLGGIENRKEIGRHKYFTKDKVNDVTFKFTEDRKSLFFITTYII